MDVNLAARGVSAGGPPSLRRAGEAGHPLGRSRPGGACSPAPESQNFSFPSWPLPQHKTGDGAKCRVSDAHASPGCDLLLVVVRLSGDMAAAHALCSSEPGEDLATSPTMAPLVPPPQEFHEARPSLNTLPQLRRPVGFCL